MMTSRRIQLLLHPQPIVSPSFRCSHFQNMAARGIGDNYLLNRGSLGKLKERRCNDGTAVFRRENAL